MKADVTAENKPAYSKHRIRANVGACGENTHKYQRGVQVVIVSLDESLVMIVRGTLEFIVKLGGGVAGRPEARKEVL